MAGEEQTALIGSIDVNNKEGTKEKLNLVDKLRMMVCLRQCMYVCILCTLYIYVCICIWVYIYVFMFV